MKKELKEYRTDEQFESIIENMTNGNWRDAARECIEYGFYSQDLEKKNEELCTEVDPWSVVALVELATEMRNDEKE